jgi:hypothetical protein
LALQEILTAVPQREENLQSLETLSTKRKEELSRMNK